MQIVNQKSLQLFGSSEQFKPKVHEHTAAELIDKRVDIGKITAEIAKAKAETEFEKYRVIQDRIFMFDFDKYMLELEANNKIE